MSRHHAKSRQPTRAVTADGRSNDPAAKPLDTVAAKRNRAARRRIRDARRSNNA